MSDSILTKICSKCQIEKPLDEFAKARDGVRGDCKKCRGIYNKLYQQKNKEALRAYHKAYRKEHKEERSEYHKEYNKKYYKENLVDISRKGKAYYASNKDKITIKHREYNRSHREEAAEYRNLHREEKNEYAKRYREENPDKIADYVKNNRKKIAERDKEYRKGYRKTKKGHDVSIKSRHKYKALKLGATVEDFSPLEVFERDGYRCQICMRKTRPDFKDPFHPLYPNLDHIQPLSKGGEHSRRNTQVLCRQCNMEKNNKENFGDQLRLFG